MNNPLHGFLMMFTFPGAIVHAFTRQFFCRLMGVPVYDTVYFSMEDYPCKYVKREELPPGKAFVLICLGWVFNVLLGAALLAPVSLTMFRLGLFSHADPWTIVLNLLTFWVGFSIVLHSFPSREELEELRTRVLGNKEAPWILRALAAPFFLVMSACVWGDVAFVDVFLSVAAVLLIREILRVFLP
ncbi:MAG: hypothetical protein FWD25_02600 [Clostridia bacterium]|nr:hypothetical protein [Clostridia bacterium]